MSRTYCFTLPGVLLMWYTSRWAISSLQPEAARAASGCKLEIAQRDVYHINNTPGKVKQYVRLIRESLEEYWKP